MTDTRFIGRPKMVAGSEVDSLIDELIVGRPRLTQEFMAAEAKKVWKSQPGTRHFTAGFDADGTEMEWRFTQRTPRYSQVIEPAMQVIEKMRRLGYSVVMNNRNVAWTVTFIGPEKQTRNGYGRDLPAAIALAALAPDCGHSWTDYKDCPGGHKNLISNVSLHPERCSLCNGDMYICGACVAVAQTVAMVSTAGVRR